MLGYFLIPVNSAQKCFVIVGVASAGKSVLLRVLNDVLLGKYASVILRRAVENGIAPENIFVERDGKQIPYADLVKEVELPDGTE